MGEDQGWSSVPFCPALRNQRRMIAAAAESEGEVNCRPCIKEAHARFLDFEPLVRISSRVRNLIKAVREYAVANYNTGAWDIIVEAYTDSELAELVHKCRTGAGAIAKVAKVVGLYAERRAPHDAEIAAATETTVFSDPQQPEPYDRFAVGSHPDGSVVRASHTHDGELVAVTRTWPGKVGWGQIETEYEGDEPGEFYHPGWRGVIIESPGFCQHEAAPGEVCWSRTCGQPQCCPF
jgi:hypothetical protein